MAQATARPDVDIIEDIEDLIVHYPPTMRDRHYFHVTSQNGHVTVRGHVKSPITRSILLEILPQVEGVIAVNADELYDDESIRLDVGRLVEPGVMFANVQYGVVVLSGRVPPDMQVDRLKSEVSKTPGVRQVITAFKNT